MILKLPIIYIFEMKNISLISVDAIFVRYFKLAAYIVNGICLIMFQRFSTTKAGIVKSQFSVVSCFLVNLLEYCH